MQDNPETKGHILPSQTAVEKICNKEISNMRLYHGTSEKMADTIGTSGFIHENKPHSVIDIQYLDGVLSRFGIIHSGSYSQGRENKFFVTSNLEFAINYAIAGPEILNIHVLSYADEFIERFSKGELEGRVTQEEIDEIKAIKQRAIDVLNSHRPAMIVTDVNAPTIRKTIEARRDYAAQYYDMQAFVTAAEESIDFEFYTDVLVGALSNFDIQEQMQVDEVKQVLKGKDFFDLNWQSERLGEIYEYCFENIDKAPPNLVGIIDTFRGSNKDVDMIKSTSKYYGLSDSDTQIVVERAFKLLEKKGQFKTK